MTLKKTADYIHPIWNWWGPNYLKAGIYGGRHCECCSLEPAKTDDGLCIQCDEHCRGKEWCPI